jgi:hypothetical protein
VLDQLQKANFDDMASTITMVKQSKAGVGALLSAGIPFVVTKGPGIAVEGVSISDRPYTDIDLIVDPSRFVKARSVLNSSGYTEHSRSVQAWDCFNRFCREAINLRTEDGGSIDLHHRVSPWYWSTGLTLDVLKSTEQAADVFGVRLPIVSLQHNLLVSALHVVSDKSRPGQTYRAWRDLLVLASGCPVDAVIDTASESGLSAWLTWILGCLPAEVQPVELLDRLVGRQRRLNGNWRLRMSLPPRFGSQHLLGQIFRLPVPHASLFTAGMLVPSPGYLRLRYPDETHRYLTWWRASLNSLGQEARDQAS